MQEETILIDRLEDQLIDNPDADTKKELHDSSLDETFQKKLNAKAEQIAIKDSEDGDINGEKSSNDLSFLARRMELDYVYTDFGSLEKELNEWFVHYDFKMLELTSLPDIYNEHLDKYKQKHTLTVGQNPEIEFIKSCIDDLSSPSSSMSNSLECLLYFAFGKFGKGDKICEQINNIRDKTQILYSMNCFPVLCELLKLYFLKIVENDDLDVFDDVETLKNYFRTLTILYFIINCTLKDSDNPQFLSIREYLERTDLLSDIVSFIERWKVSPSSNYRVRNLILLLWKLILLEFGNSELIDSCDKFLIDHHNIQNKCNDENKLVCSPLDYYTFREDLLDKYPLFNEDVNLKLDPYDFKQFGKTLDEINGQRSQSSNNSSTSSFVDEFNNFMALSGQSSSLSNHIAYPRPNKFHTIQSQLPAQTLHISTPVPSPTNTPSDFMSGGGKVRKLYQVNQSMPLIYPMDGGIEVPYAIKEADDILQRSVYNSYSNKRLWEERQKFMTQERGYLNTYEQHNKDEIDDHSEFDYNKDDLLKKYPNKHVEISSIMRVEKFYSRNLDKLANLVEVLVNIFKTMKIDASLDMIEKELNGTTCYYEGDKESKKSEKKKQIDKILIQQLEVIRAKEITLKASSHIILLMLKWFKINHISKYYYLTCILFDQLICTVAVDFLRGSFDNFNIQKPKKDDENDYDRLLYQNQLMNPPINLPQFQFFNICTGNNPSATKTELINTTKLEDFPTIIDNNNVSKTIIDKYNENFCFIMVNIVTILNKVLLKNYTQRILTFNECKPSEIFRMLVTNFDNKYLTIPILKIVKKMIPYQGRKWKSFNMGLISLIYMRLKLSMRDNWLSGKDLENDFNNSLDQEISLRGLLQFYNMRKYPDKMMSLGYEISKDFQSFPLDEDFDHL